LHAQIDTRRKSAETGVQTHREKAEEQKSRVWPGLLRLVVELDGDRLPPGWRSLAGSRLHELQADEVEVFKTSIKHAVGTVDLVGRWF
jgi:hypothetical protein